MVGMPSVTQHLDALLLALASSTDNFTVGLSVGICHKDLSVWENVVISLCNATGALIAGYGGLVLSQGMPLLAPLLATTAFAYLAVQEFIAYYQQSYKREEAPIHLVRLALPMTLNNLAGGVAAGAAGLSPLISALYALLASFGTMAVGYAIGRRLGRTSLPADPSLLAGILLGALCLMTIQEALSQS